VRLWMLSGEPLEVLTDVAGLGRPLHFIAYSPDGARLAAASNQGNIYLWNNEGKALATLETDSNLRDLVWRPDSSGLAAAVDHDLVVCSRDGELQLQTSKRQGVILGCHWTGDGGLLAADERGNVRVFDIAGEVVDQWSTSLAPLRSAKIDPQGRQLVVGLERGALYGWDLATRRPTFTAALVDDKVLAFDAAGRFLNKDETDISPLLYCVETPEGFRLMTHEEFAARMP
jgi:WD40 repeat protein